MGIEEHGEPAEVEEFRSTVLARQIEAEEAFVGDGDPGPRMDLWSKNDPVTLFGAIGMSQSGWDKLSATFASVASRFSDVSDFHFDVEVVGVDASSALTDQSPDVRWSRCWCASRISTGARTAFGRSSTATPTIRVPTRAWRGNERRRPTDSRGTRRGRLAA
jgi:hypothetical protein